VSGPYAPCGFVVPTLQAEGMNWAYAGREVSKYLAGGCASLRRGYEARVHARAAGGIVVGGRSSPRREGTHWPCRRRSEVAP
jgi:hypothetical protein